MGPEVEENVTLDSKPLTITVKPLPEKDKPSDFSGAVGKFSITSALVNRNVTAQDEADLKVTVAGSGNLPVISAPSVNWPAGMDSFDPTAKEDINKTIVPLSGYKTFDYVFTTKAPGHYTIPPLSLSYFDPAAREYKRVQSQPVDFEVTAGKKSKGLPKPGLVVAKASNGRRGVEGCGTAAPGNDLYDPDPVLSGLLSVEAEYPVEEDRGGKGNEQGIGRKGSGKPGRPERRGRPGIRGPDRPVKAVDQEAG